MRSPFSKFFRFVFGDDDRVTSWLIALGGISSAAAFLLIMGAIFFLADAPPASATEAFSDLFWGLFRTTGTWFLLIGIGALMVRRHWTIFQTHKPMVTTPESTQGKFAMLFGNDYRVALWIMVMGAVWASERVFDVAPSFLRWGMPPGYVGIGSRDDLPPPVEQVVEDALIPMALYILTHSVGMWITITGAAIALLQWGRRRVRHD